MVAQIFEKLAATASRNDKIAILTEHKDNKSLQAVLRAALDPYVTYHIKKIPAYEPEAGLKLIDIDAFLASLHTFSSRKLTGHAAINRLTSLLEQLPADDAVIATRIIKKDLRCGVQDSTVNKVWKGLVPTYPCLLGKAYDEKSIKNIIFPAYSQTKADGMRCNVFFDTATSEIEVRGRSGKTIDLLGALDQDFKELGQAGVVGSVVFDGELVVLEDDGTIMPRKKGNGLLNKAIKGTISADEASRVRMRLWDIIPMSDFFKYKCPIPYTARLIRLREYVDAAPDSEKYSIIDYKVVNTLDEAWAHYEELQAAGEEGSMLKNMNHIWENKRSKCLVKMKAELECDLEVIGYNPGTIGTKNEGKMGSLICASLDRKVEVSISGFPDDLRDEITENFDDWVSCIVTVKYNERIESKDKNRQDVDSLFLPRFLERRYDKDVADDSSKIK